MAKQLVGSAKFQIPGGQATPAPPVGTSLGKYGINLGQFVQQFNERTKEAGGMMIPVVVTVYNDRSFEFITKSPPAAVLLKKAANIAKGSAVPNKDKVGTRDAGPDGRDRQDQRWPTSTPATSSTPCDMIAGTARSMGLEVERLIESRWRSMQAATVSLASNIRR